MTHDDLTLSEDELRQLLEGDGDVPSEEADVLSEPITEPPGDTDEQAQPAADEGHVGPVQEADDAASEGDLEPPLAYPGPTSGPKATATASGQRQTSRPRPRAKVQPVEFGPLYAESSPHRKQPLDLGILFDVPLRVTVELGRTQMSVRELLEIGPGSVIELDRSAGEVLDVLVNGVPIAQGEVVVVDEQFGVRITQVFDASGRELLDTVSRK